MLAGVCGGLAEYFGFDATMVRIVYFFALIIPGGIGILLVMAFMFGPSMFLAPLGGVLVDGNATTIGRERPWLDLVRESVQGILRSLDYGSGGRERRPPGPAASPSPSERSRAERRRRTPRRRRAHMLAR